MDLPIYRKPPTFQSFSVDDDIDKNNSKPTTTPTLSIRPATTMPPSTKLMTLPPPLLYQTCASHTIRLTKKTWQIIKKTPPTLVLTTELKILVAKLNKLL